MTADQESAFKPSVGRPGLTSCRNREMHSFSTKIAREYSPPMANLLSPEEMNVAAHEHVLLPSEIQLPVVPVLLSPEG